MLFLLIISLLYISYLCSASATHAGRTHHPQRLEAHVQEQSAAVARATQAWDTALQLRAEQLADTAHDLNNWSQQIVTANEMLRQFVDSSDLAEIGRGYEAVAEAVQCCCVIEQALHEQRDLLTVMVALTRLDAGLSPSVRLVPTHLGSLVQQIARQCQTYLQAQGATLQVMVPSDLPLVSCDPRYVKRVIAVSIRNRLHAIKGIQPHSAAVLQMTLTSDAASVRCCIGVRDSDADADHITISVPALHGDQTDTSCPEQDIDADVALCRRLITLHPGGRFTSQATVDTGIYVLFQLPLALSTQEQRPSLLA